MYSFSLPFMATNVNIVHFQYLNSNSENDRIIPNPFGDKHRHRSEPEDHSLIVGKGVGGPEASSVSKSPWESQQ